MARNAYELGLGLSEEHTALADSVAAFAERTLTSETVRAKPGSTAQTGVSCGS